MLPRTVTPTSVRLHSTFLLSIRLGRNAMCACPVCRLATPLEEAGGVVQALARMVEEQPVGVRARGGELGGRLEPGRQVVEQFDVRAERVGDGVIEHRDHRLVPIEAETIQGVYAYVAPFGPLSTVPEPRSSRPATMMAGRDCLSIATPPDRPLRARRVAVRHDVLLEELTDLRRSTRHGTSAHLGPSPDTSRTPSGPGALHVDHRYAEPRGRLHRQTPVVVVDVAGHQRGR